MREIQFGSVYNKLKLPVIVCAATEGTPITFLNGSARLLFAPTLSVERMKGQQDIGNLEDVLRFRNREEFAAFHQMLRDVGSVVDMDSDVLSFQDDVISVRINANAGVIDDLDYFFIYLSDSSLSAAGHKSGAELGAFTTRILQASHHITNVDEAIQAILGLAGTSCNVSRAYIFEDISKSVTRNTYEWCAEGVEPAIENLQNLDKKDYNYDAIMNSAGMLITDDTGQLPDSDREILQAQGIRAIAILPLYHFDTPLGYIGFDDCVSNRRWTMEEIQLLQNVASVVSSLVNRRNSERKTERSREIVQTVTDNLEDLVYVSDLDTYELKFISKSLARVVDLPADEILGKPCWTVFDPEQECPCSFCPLPELRVRRERGESGSYTWERHSDAQGKWYLVKDNIVEWLDGESVHLCTYVDITYRKQYEEQLKHFASIDAMTDVYNRKWGYDKLSELFGAVGLDRSQMTLCFIDLDGLKITNDRYGHAAGDEMIQETVRTILSCIRKNDFIVRWGGDEFILMLHCDLADAAKVMEKIRFGVDHFNHTRKKDYILSFSYGLVDFSGPYGTLDELVDTADARMYENKAFKRRDAERRNSRRIPSPGEPAMTKSTDSLDKDTRHE